LTSDESGNLLGYDAAQVQANPVLLPKGEVPNNPHGEFQMIVRRS